MKVDFFPVNLLGGLDISSVNSYFTSEPLQGLSGKTPHPSGRLFFLE